jgi:outer membrane protein TolC
LEHEVGFVKTLLMLLLIATCSQARAETVLPVELAQAVQSAISTHPEVLAADSQRMSAKSQVKAGEYRWYAVEAAKQAVSSEERKLTQTSTAFWADYTTALNRSLELEKFSASAEETVRLFKRQFTIGRRSWPEVTNTLQDLYSAQTQKVDAKYAAMSSRIKLAFVTGEFDDLLNLSVTTSKLASTNSSVR